MKGEPGVSLVPIDNSNRDAVRAILVTSHHERRFVRQTAETLEWGAEKLERAAAAELEPMFWLVYSGSTTVGFVTIFDDVEPPSIEHSLWGLLIDERYPAARIRDGDPRSDRRPLPATRGRGDVDQGG